jgi:hypothetical protein
MESFMESVMQIKKLQMGSFNTTLMGVLRGVLDYYGIPASTPMLYGGSGHAFLLNIHTELCPSGPYCWHFAPFLELVKNLGVEMTALGSFQTDVMVRRDQIEEILRQQLDAGTPCSLLNKEHQLITGYDEQGFLTAQPWPWNPNFPPLRLSYALWPELGDEFYVTFYTFRRVEPADETTLIRASLDYALNLQSRPERYTNEPYGVGPVGYAKWIQAIHDGHGDTHGNWWNGIVWSECRREAAGYFGEIAARYSKSAKGPAEQLAWHYARIADMLQAVSDKTTDSARKIRLLEEAARTESEATSAIAELAAALPVQ